MERTKQQSSRKGPKASDGLSELPDSVLCHILSFLPTKLSVSTSILARRWRFLWIHVPNLNFYGKYHPNWSKEGLSFSDIIDKVMLQHDVQNLTTFSLSYSGKKKGLRQNKVETWLSTAVSRKVQNIDISLPYNIVLPPCLLTCKTLVDLRINVCTLEIILPNSVYLPSLKKLYLHNVLCKTDKTLSHLISGCPVLEELLIDEIVCDGLAYVSISSPSIKWLKVEWDLNVQINAPALTYLRIDGCSFDHISAGMLTSLTKADVNFRNHMVERGSSTVFQFVERLCNVKWLALSIQRLKFLDSAFSTSTIRFHNLTKLHLSADWQFISMFLQNADSLQHLHISGYDKELKCWVEPKQIPACLLSCLRTISIFEFGHEEHEFRMVRYLLKNAQVLKKMRINSEYISGNYEEKFHGLQRISEFERGSVACRLFFA